MVSKKAAEFEGGAEGAKELGIIPDCAYFYIGDRNPDGKNLHHLRRTITDLEDTQWKGAFCPGSESWTDEAKEQIGWVAEDEENGKFFIEHDDMLKHFSTFGIAYIYDNNSLQSVKKTGNEGIFKVSIESPGDYTFSLSQKGAKMFAKNSGYQYSVGRMHIF